MYAQSAYVSLIGVPGVAPVEAGPLIGEPLEEVPHVLLRGVDLPVVLLAGVVVLAVHPVRVQLPPLIRKQLAH